MTRSTATAVVALLAVLTLATGAIMLSADPAETFGVVSLAGVIAILFGLAGLAAVALASAKPDTVGANRPPSAAGSVPPPAHMPEGRV